MSNPLQGGRHFARRNRKHHTTGYMIYQRQDSKIGSTLNLKYGEIQESEKAQTIGYLYEFDCKPEVFVDNLDDKWLAVAFEKQLGYVQRDAQIQVQSCPGNQPEEDKLTTTPHTTILLKTTDRFTTHSTALTSSAINQTLPSVTVTSSRSAALETTRSATTSASSMSLASSETTSPEPVKASSVYLTSVTSSIPVTVPVSPTISKTSEIYTNPNITTLSSQHVTDYTKVNLSSITLSTLTRDIISTLSSSPKPRDIDSYTSRTAVISVLPTSYTVTNGQMTVTSSSSDVSSVSSPLSSTTSVGKILTTPPLTSPSLVHTTSYAKLLPNVLKGDVSKCTESRLQGHFHSQFGKYCYELVTHFNRQWLLSELYCKAHGGYLLSASGAAEVEYIYQLLKWRNVSEPIWTGLNDQNQEEIFQWSSGEPVTYFNEINWKRGRKGLGHDKEDCVLLNPAQYPGEWDDVDCHSSHAFVCKYKITEGSSVKPPFVTSPATQSPYGACKPRYSGSVTQVGPHCFEFVDSYVTWFEARSICSKTGARLAEIINSRVQSRLINFTHDSAIKEQMWIGLHDLEQNRHFQWNNGQHVSYFTYWQNNPSATHDNPGLRECVVMLPSGKWSAVTCYPEHNYPVLYPFLCEYDTEYSQAPVLVG